MLVMNGQKGAASETKEIIFKNYQINVKFALSGSLQAIT